MTTTSPVKFNVNTQRGKKVGTIVGAGVSTGYIAKNAKPLFTEIPQMAVESGLSKKVGYAASSAAAIIVSACIIGAGRLIGAGVGKIVDKIKQKKAVDEAKEIVAETINSNKNLKEIEPISVKEMQKINDMSEEEAEAYISSRFKQPKVVE